MSKQKITTEQIKDFEDKVSAVFNQHDYYQHTEIMDCENIDETKITMDDSVYFQTYINDRWVSSFEYVDGNWYIKNNDEPINMEDLGITFEQGYNIPSGAKFNIYSEYLQGKTQFTISQSVKINHVFLNGLLLEKHRYDSSGSTIFIKNPDGTSYEFEADDSLTII